jgi:hypothetical protein
MSRREFLVGLNACLRDMSDPIEQLASRFSYTSSLALARSCVVILATLGQEVGPKPLTLRSSASEALMAAC